LFTPGNHQPPPFSRRQRKRLGLMPSLGAWRVTDADKAECDAVMG
jgi:hypothetical protein